MKLPFFIDDLVPLALLEAASTEAEELAGEPGGFAYNNPLEKKRMKEIGNSAGLHATVEHLYSEEVRNRLSGEADIAGLVPDWTLYGAGLSIVPSGGFLALHKDLSIHPQTGMERRLNVALFLNLRWDRDWGGNLEFWFDGEDGKPRGKLDEIRPCFGRVVVFDPATYHGFPDQLLCSPDVSRLSLQIFYYAAPRRETEPRTRAHFSLRPGEDSDRLLNDFRLACRH